jgi:hypothetical protein
VTRALTALLALLVLAATHDGGRLAAHSHPDLTGVWTNRWIVNMADGRFGEKTIDVPLNEMGK